LTGPFFTQTHRPDWLKTLESVLTAGRAGTKQVRRRLNDLAKPELSGLVFALVFDHVT
jgi:hypothetical protein